MTVSPANDIQHDDFAGLAGQHFGLELARCLDWPAIEAEDDVSDLQSRPGHG